MAESAVLYVEVMGGARLIVAMGAGEGGRTIERCLHRVDVVISGHGGQVLERSDSRMLVGFASAGEAMNAYGEMLQKVMSMPPQRGVQLGIRAGLHVSAAPVSAASDEAARVAEALMKVAGEDQAFASLQFCEQVGIARRADGLRTLMVNNVLWEALPVAGNEEVVQRAEVVVEPEVAAPVVETRPAVGLRLRHREHAYVLDEEHASLAIGRDRSCQIMIEDKRASRVHARVELRDGVPYLVDQSSNGTSLAIVGEDEEWLRRSEVALKGMGRFGCGFTCSEEQEADAPDLRVYFEPL